MTLAETAARFGRTTDVVGYTASVSPSFDSELDLWSRMADSGGALPFQSREWLVPWSATIGRRADLKLLAVTIRDGGGRPVVGLPLVCERKGLRRIGFADGGLADYNAPILGRDAPQDAAGAARIWSALVRALPKADVIRFERMPARIGTMANPLALLPRARPAAIGGLDLRLTGSYADWLQALPRRYRKELGRCTRLFEALPDARFERVRGTASSAFDALEHLQRERIDALDLPYVLDEPDARDFYRRLAADLSGAGVLTTVVAESRIVAVLFGMRRGSRYIMLRIGADPAYARMSPARHLITQTMEAMRAEGVEYFDFGLGDYVYKRKLGAQPIHLFDLVAARSPFGAAEATAFRLKAHVRKHAPIHATAKRLRGLLRR